ncbi:unnamed protein product, partial [Pylaiella littoralis]
MDFSLDDLLDQVEGALNEEESPHRKLAPRRRGDEQRQENIASEWSPHHPLESSQPPESARGNKINMVAMYGTAAAAAAAAAESIPVSSAMTAGVMEATASPPTQVPTVRSLIDANFDSDSDDSPQRFATTKTAVPNYVNGVDFDSDSPDLERTTSPVRFAGAAGGHVGSDPAPLSVPKAVPGTTAVDVDFDSDDSP